MTSPLPTRPDVTLPPSLSARSRKTPEPTHRRTWIPKSAETSDGLLVIPYDEADPADEKSSGHNAKPVCWLFVLDASGSMNAMLHDKPISRWACAIRLLQRVIQDLETRTNDTVSIIRFSDKPVILAENLPVRSISHVITDLNDFKPDGGTNIQLANSAAHFVLTRNRLLRSGTHQSAEIFFTDGEATLGFLEAEQLEAHKRSLYQDIFRRTGAYPFLWCGAISDDAKWNIVRSLALASPLSLWAFIRETEMSDFAAEVGGVVHTVCAMKVRCIGPDRYVMLLPDSPNAFYVDSLELADTAITPQPAAESLVSLYRMRYLLEQHCTRQRTMDIAEVRAMLERALRLAKTDDPLVDQSLEWTCVFEKIKAEVARDLRDTIEAHESLGVLDLTRQLSETRGTFNNTTAAVRASYTSTYTNDF